jgi:putative ABC transport system permease protein
MTWARRLRLAAVLAFRDARASPASCVLATLSLAFAVAGMHGMQLVVSELSNRATSNSRQWIAADVAVQLGQSLSPAEWKQAGSIASGLQLTMVTELPAMAASSQAPDPIAVQVKAVDPKVYPFYGTLELKSGRTLESALDSGAAVVSPDLLDALQVRMGAMIRIAQADFRIADLIVAEPDRFAGPYTPAPRVIVSDAGLGRTGLLRFSDTAFRHLLYRIPRSENTGEISRRVETLFPNSEVIDYTTPMPLVSVTADWIAPFLSLVAVLALAFGAGAIAAMSYLQLLQRLDTIAILKSLGAGSAQIIEIFLLRTLGLALVGSSLGLVGGWLIQRMCGSIVLRQMGIHLDSHVQWGAASQSLLLGVLAAVAASSASLWAVRSVRPAIILRRDTGEKDLLIRDLGARTRPGLGVIVGILLPTVLLVAMGDSWLMRTLVVASIAGAAAAILVGIRLALRLCWSAGRQFSSGLPFALRHGLGNPRRYGGRTQGALLVLVAAVALILIAGLGRRQISDMVIDSLPMGANNLLLFNVDSSDVSQLSSMMKKQSGILRAPTLVPTAMLTLDRVDSADLDDLRASQPRSWVQRMWPATCSDTLPQGVRVLAGNFQASVSPITTIALEEHVAALLKAHVGSRIRFLVAGRPLNTEVEAIVRVPPVQRYWYRVTLGCQVFAGFEVNTYSGGLSVEPARLADLRRLLQGQLHRASVVNVSEVKQQGEKVAAEGVRIITVVAALLACIASALLLAAVLALRPFQVHEIAILRALGASTRTLLSALATEYAAMGAIAGLLGAPFGWIGANLILWYLTGKIAWIFDGPATVLAVGAAALLVALVGVAASRGLLRVPPLQVLRRR